VQYDEDRLKELVLYVAGKSSTDASFGAIKLNKLLFFADFWAYGAFGKPITGATYEKQRFGPVPREVKQAQSALEAAEDAVVIKRRHFYPQQKTVARREADMSLFEPRELQLIDEILEVFKDDYAEFISEFSHEISAGWQLAKMHEEIPYDSIFLSTEDISEGEIRRGRELAEQFGWN
jgi:uncharacterized phage-associated protein